MTMYTSLLSISVPSIQYQFLNAGTHELPFGIKAALLALTGIPRTFEKTGLNRSWLELVARWECRAVNVLVSKQGLRTDI